MPLVLRKEAQAGTYHPNNITIDDIRVRNTGRLAALSSIYNISITNVDFDGLDDGENGNGVQLIDLVVGDEAGRYAHADDAGKVYHNIKGCQRNRPQRDRFGRKCPVADRHFRLLNLET